MEGAESPRLPSLPSFPPLPQGRRLRRGRLGGNEHGAEELLERRAPECPGGFSRQQSGIAHSKLRRPRRSCKI